MLCQDPGNVRVYLLLISHKKWFDSLILCLCVCVCVNVCTYVSACNGDELSKASTIGLEDHYLERWVEGGKVSHCSRST